MKKRENKNMKIIQKMKVLKMKMKMQRVCNPIKIKKKILIKIKKKIPIKIKKKMKTKKTNQAFQIKKEKKVRNRYFQMLNKIQKLMNKMIKYQSKKAKNKN